MWIKHNWFRAAFFFFFFFKEMPDTWVGWRVPKKLRNPEQIFMAPLIKHTWGERLGLSLPVHLPSPQLCIVWSCWGLQTPSNRSTYSLIYNQSSLKQNKTYFLMLLSFLNDHHNHFLYFSIICFFDFSMLSPTPFSLILPTFIFQIDIMISSLL